MSSSGPIETLPLFPELSRRFVALLEDLAPEDWQTPVSERWRVRDVVAHLVDSSLRRLSTQRDAHVSNNAVSDGDYVSLLGYLNRLNAEWVAAMDRLSPRVLTDLVRWSDGELFAHLSSLDPGGPAIWPVAWAGETTSQNWFDIAREYTEKWHHAQQVFEAVGGPSTITDRALMYPCLDTFMRGLPHALRDCDAPPLTVVRVCIVGDAGGEWLAIRDEGSWKLREPEKSRDAATVRLYEINAWRIFTKRMSAAQKRNQYMFVGPFGDQKLCDAVLEMVCVMA